MLAHLHRCQLLTQPNLGEGGVARKVLQDRCRPSWQSPQGLRNALTDLAAALLAAHRGGDPVDLEARVQDHAGQDPAVADPGDQQGRRKAEGVRPLEPGVVLGARGGLPERGP